MFKEKLNKVQVVVHRDCMLLVKRVAEEKADEGEKKKPRLEEEHVQRGKERLAAKLDGRLEASVIPEQIK